MTDDEFDEMLAARHRAFVADLTTAAEPVRRVPPRRNLVAVRVEALRGVRVTAGSVALAMVLGLMFASGQRDQPDQRISASISPEPPASAVSSVPDKLKAVPGSASSSARRTAPQTAAAPSNRGMNGEDPPPPPPPVEVEPASSGEELTLWFAANSVELTADEADLVHALSRRLQEEDQVSVVGHTSRIGRADSAFEFSLRRANAVRAELLRAGTADFVIKCYGVGYTQARTEVDARDRRVVVTVTRPVA
ncbi:OmpA family protein [Lentzea sp. NPDC059081]|uniref:OmpA family protein n=1 Tax=Lentzea sp. NPDC059081 TaxID=3346719 RepID=UPI0036B99BBE